MEPISRRTTGEPFPRAAISLLHDHRIRRLKFAPIELNSRKSRKVILFNLGRAVPLCRGGPHGAAPAAATIDVWRTGGLPAAEDVADCFSGRAEKVGGCIDNTASYVCRGICHSIGESVPVAM